MVPDSREAAVAEAERLAASPSTPPDEVQAVAVELRTLAGRSVSNVARVLEWLADRLDASRSVGEGQQLDEFQLAKALRQVEGREWWQLEPFKLKARAVLRVLASQGADDGS